MKIFICASKHNYKHIPEIKSELEKAGHDITLPNSFDDPMKEEEIKQLGHEDHSKWKGDMLRLQKEKVKANDCILVLNFEKNGQPNYIGGATFLEVYNAFDFGKKIYFYNPIPECNFTDELIGMGVEVIDGDLTKLE